MNGFAQEWWDFLARKEQWETTFDNLIGGGSDYNRITTDIYDESISIRGASNNWRLNNEQISFLRDAGFGKCYIYHDDGWESHYDLKGNKSPWRRRYVRDEDAKTDRVISGDPDPGYWEISYWPGGWSSDTCHGWLKSGYMRIVPDEAR